MLSKEKKIKMESVFRKWDNPDHEEGDSLCMYDWRSMVFAKLREGDISGMRRAALPAVQSEVIRISLEGKNEQTRLAAAQFVLAQEGQGGVQKVESSIVMEKLPADQLSSIVASKLMRLQKIDPNFSIKKLLAAAAIKQDIGVDGEVYEGEVIEDDESPVEGGDES